MDVKAYIEQGKGLEEFLSPGPWKTVCEGSQWHIDGPEMQSGLYTGDTKRICSMEGWDGDAWSFTNAEFIADARDRLPIYRKALEAVLEILDKPWEDSAEFYCLRCREISAAIQENLKPSS